MLRVMAKRRVDLMLEPLLVERVDAAAARLRWSRTTFVTAALEGMLEDARGGVPDLPRADVENVVENERGELVKGDPAKPASFEFRLPEMEERPVPNPPASPRVPVRNYAMERQAKLNAAKERRQG
jgi:hypothetical protein